jgi:hypothetical protein
MSEKQQCDQTTEKQPPGTLKRKLDDVVGSTDAQPGGAKAKQKRPMCSRCERVAKACVCSSIPSPPVDTLVQTVVLTHPKEATQPMRTGLFARLGLRNCSEFVGRSFAIERFPDLHTIVNSKPDECLVLYPATDAKPIAQFEPGATAAASPGAAESSSSSAPVSETQPAMEAGSKRKSVLIVSIVMCIDPLVPRYRGVIAKGMYSNHC